MINRSGETDRIRFEKTGPIYSGTMFSLLIISILGILSLPWLLNYYITPVAADTLRQSIPVAVSGWELLIGNTNIPILVLVAAFLLLPATLMAALFIRFKHVDRVSEYACGEKINYAFGSFYLSADGVSRYAYPLGFLFFLALIVVALL
jgi:hypothetical protein